MRETCARVLAAALMTGAIATVVGMPALFGAQPDPASSIAAPPSSLQRAVRIPAAVVRPPHRRQVERLETAPSIKAVAKPATVIARRVVVVRPTTPRPHRRLAASKPRPAPPAPRTPPATPPAEPAVVAATPTEVPDASAPDKEHGNGHAYGHDKDDEHGHGGHDE